MEDELGREKENDEPKRMDNMMVIWDRTVGTCQRRPDSVCGRIRPWAPAACPPCGRLSRWRICSMYEWRCASWDADTPPHRADAYPIMAMHIVGCGHAAGAQGQALLQIHRGASGMSLHDSVIRVHSRIVLSGIHHSSFIIHHSSFNSSLTPGTSAPSMLRRGRRRYPAARGRRGQSTRRCRADTARPTQD